MKIRPGTLLDLSALAEVEHAADQLFPEGRIPDGDDTYPEEGFRRAIHQGLLFIFEEDEQPVGFAVSEEVDRRLHLFALAVHPEFGRRGLGKRLVLRVLEESSRRQLEGVSLTTFEDLPWNGPFYAKLGFRILEHDEQSPMLQEVLRSEAAVGMDRRVAMLYAPSDRRVQ